MRKLLIRLLASVALVLAPHAMPAAPATDQQVADRALLMAAEAGRADLVGFALDNGADPRARDARAGQPTALMLAAAGGHAQAVTLLLARGADANGPGRGTQPPLLLAIRAASEPMVGLLLGAGADPNARDAHTGNTPLMLAANTGHAAIVEALLARGADPLAHATDGWTAAQAARMIGEEALAQRIEQAARR